MTPLQGFLAQLSVPFTAAVTPILPPQSRLYEGRNMDGPLWMAQTPDQIFLSGDRRHFHELQVSQRFEVPAGQRSLKYPTHLSLTPRLGGIALLWDPMSPRVLFNHAEQEDRLMRVLLTNVPSAQQILKEAAFFTFSGGEAPTLEGALGRWWEAYASVHPTPEPAVPFPTLTHVMSRVVHAVNNANCIPLSNGPMVDQALGALQVFLEAVSESPEARNAVAKALRAHPRADEIDALLHHIRDLTPMPEAQTADPITLLNLSVQDTRVMVADMHSSAPRVTDFLRTVNERLKQDLPTGVASAERIVAEAEQEFHAASRAQSVSDLAPVSPKVRREITVPVLYVEDDGDAGEMTMNALAREGFSKVTWAKSVQEALNIFESRGDIALVLSDFDLGQESGLEMFRRMRRLRPQTRVLFVSGNEDGLRSQMTEKEREEFEILPKPYEIDDLGERLRAIADQ